MPWYYAVAERDHELSNPTSAEKIRLLGDYLRLGPETRVLDIASGQGGPALVLASTYGCRILGVERSPEFVAVARQRIAAAGLQERIEVVESDAQDYAIDAADWDVALCLGATFVYGGLEQTLDRFDGIPKVAIGEVFPHDELPGVVAAFERAGRRVHGVIASSQDDWDRYYSLQWRALEEYLAEHDDPEIRSRLERDRNAYLSHERRELGWAIFAARLRAPAAAAR